MPRMYLSRAKSKRSSGTKWFRRPTSNLFHQRRSSRKSILHYRSKKRLSYSHSRQANKVKRSQMIISFKLRRRKRKRTKER
jgi:hypothetical protein